MQQETLSDAYGEIEISFGYQCNNNNNTNNNNKKKIGIPEDAIVPDTRGGGGVLAGFRLQKTSSFSCLSGAALSGNPTLANTNICNGVIGSEILPSLDSPKSFRKVPSSPALSKLDILSPSLHGSMASLSCSPSPPDPDSCFLTSMSSPSSSVNEGFVLSAMEVQVAGGAAGEDRVQAVCSEENGWLFCAIYDGFNGRDAADFLACTLYESIVFHLQLLDHQMKNHQDVVDDGCVVNVMIDSSSSDLFRQGVLDCLNRALLQAENDFLRMVEQEMEERPDLVSVGSCVLVTLLFGKDLYVMNLGDSRAVLATYNGNKKLQAVQLTEDHTVDNEIEEARLLSEHLDDPKIVIGGKIKGKLKVTRALGVGYLKKEKLNDALMGILRVRNLLSPPYVSVEPSMRVHKITESDHFVIVASDGLFDFFSNEEAIELVHGFIASNPCGDPAKFLLERLVAKAAARVGFTLEELMNVPAGRKRRYHDDVTVMVITLGTDQRTSKASTFV
ncbi:putative protein phosphatase 2C 40 [Raphanus sativus]|uniref:Probable protein phosphatase 2C 40 n=1 Tax=Raphanus sativus TaxID=3726 RepID=A0A6J0P5Q2_RAPSA|nr:probable protein phosphatase 2C 40 [Raphanus sativus]KAJ4893790.1 putative protein phosphatase 2C 40 [Raphanus sativus]